MPTVPIRVELPQHLRTLASVAGHEVTLEVESPPTIAGTLDALEAAYPMLAGTIRDHVTRERRAFLRFFACQQDLSLEPADTPLPPAVVTGSEPLIVLGAVAGGR
jgi:hypothetical protein